jgi:hypothetical protein
MSWRSVRVLFLAGVLGACGGDVKPGDGGDGDGDGPGDGDGDGSGDGDGDGDGSGDGDGDGSGDGDGDGDPTDPDSGPPAGNPDGSCEVPAEGQAEDTSSPDRVVGTGTPASCTSVAFVEAVAQGGVITFDCGPDPVTIELDATAKVFNDKGPRIVIDGGGKVTLSGRNERRILYQNTCDAAQMHTTSHCDNQDHPQLTVQNLTFVDGNAQGEPEERAGGGAIFAQGGRLKIVNSRFFHNQAAKEGQDVGGGAVRSFMQFDGQPVYVVNSTFGGPEASFGNEAANGGGLSSIGVSWTVLNSVFANNRAVGNGGNPAKQGTVGGGSGGAIYNDGGNFTLRLCGVDMHDNQGREYGGGIFFVSNENAGGVREGHMFIDASKLKNNVSEDKAADQYPGIFVLQGGEPEITNSTIE